MSLHGHRLQGLVHPIPQLIRGGKGTEWNAIANWEEKGGLQRLSLKTLCFWRLELPKLQEKVGGLLGDTLFSGAVIVG
jgi:hypothetical protein